MSAGGGSVLIVDDDVALVRTLSITLRAHGYDVAACADGRSAIASAQRSGPDLVIVDLGLPDIDGLDVVTAIRSRSDVPVLVLSARQGEPDKVSALDAGADDYLTKPFGVGELLARMRAAIRRRPEADAAPVVRTRAFTVDLAAAQVSDAAGVPVKLTGTEWHVLEVLARNVGRLVTHQQLLLEVWGPAYGTETNYLRVYVAQLRRKLEADPSTPQHLLTEARRGYRLVP